MTQFELEVAICEVKTHYQVEMEKKMQVIRKNKLQRIKHENEIMLIKAANCTLYGEVETLRTRMSEELLPLLQQHAAMRAQGSEEQNAGAES